MKKLTLFIISAFIIQASIYSQPCLPEGITFTTQAQIDNFQTNYPNCTEIEGDVIIEGDYITNLNGLSVLTSIGGALWIRSNDALTSLTGLEGLTSIERGLSIDNNDALTSLTGLEGLNSIGGWFSIRSNDALTSLTGLEDLTSIGGDSWILYNDALTSLTGLEGLTSSSGDLDIYGNAALTSLTGLEDLTSIGGYFSIRYNDALTSLTGLEDLTSIGGDLIIGDYHNGRNNALTSLTGLEGLTSIGGDIRIYRNDALTSLSGLEGLTSIGGDIRIYRNDALTSLSGLEGPISIGGDLTIEGNYSLCSCEADAICGYLSNPTGAVNIYNNAPGCNNPSEIADSCGFTISCLPYGNYHFNCQDDIDHFQDDYPGCTELNGIVRISGFDITNLNGLSVLTSIGGNLDIDGNNNHLTSLTGLEGLTSIGGALDIYSNAALTSLTGLEGLTSIGGCLVIGGQWNGNNALTSLTGLEGLTSIGGDLDIDGNNDLTSLTGLEGLTSIGGALDIYSNAALTSLTGLENIDAGSIEWLQIYNNPNLSECAVQSICDYLASPYGFMDIYNNATGCNSQQEVQEACWIVNIGEGQTAEDQITIYPNPLTSTAKLSGQFATAATVNICIYNITGICLKSWEFANQQSGKQEITLNLNDLPPGIYFCRLQAGSEVVVKKMIKN